MPTGVLARDTKRKRRSSGQHRPGSGGLAGNLQGAETGHAGATVAALSLPDMTTLLQGDPKCRQVEKPKTGGFDRV
jgi:hypothetical protein